MYPEPITRLMCWAHVDRAIDRSGYLAAVRKESKEIAERLMEDMEKLQWTAQNEASFRKLFHLLKQKYESPESLEVKKAIDSFFKYVNEIWVESKEFR